jgi:hypothetical protein
MVGFNEIQFVVSGQQSIPVGIFCATAKKQSYSNASQLHIGHRIIAMQAAAVLYGLPAGKQLDKFLSTEPFFLKQVFGLAHFDHTQIVAAGVPGFDELNNVGACKPTVGQQIIKTHTFTDSVLDHFNSFLNLALGVLTNAIVNGIGLLTHLGVLFLALYLCHAKRLFRTAPFLSVKREVQNRLRFTIGTAKKKAFESKTGGMGYMRKDATHLLDFGTGFWQVGVINDQAHRVLTVESVVTHVDFSQQLFVDTINQIAPVDSTIFQKAIKNIFLTRHNLC